MDSLRDFLKKHNLRTTAVRQAVLQLFIDQKSALSQGEIEQAFKGQFDRVTIYRTLKSFEEKAVIHSVIDNGAVMKYALCEESCEEHDHQDNHVHFKCTQCKQTFCLHHIPVEEFSLPQGFRANDYQLLVVGSCEKCNQPSA